ncbi:MAG TPA: M20 family metallo-hydrolase [Candidatus Sulfotelmatobacter sp.]|nr:M20 family metallo-hydrolase [Candidatus Sulfotelmatobacter sp.]
MLLERLAELARLGATADGIDRALFTAPERAAREHFAAWARAAGLHVSQDLVGNVFARLDGREDGPPILTGSHLDTVKDGGAYDGAYGVVAGLEVLARVAARGERPKRALEAVAWAGEEGSRFPLGCLGSSIFAGVTSDDVLETLVDDEGVSFTDALHGETGRLPDVPIRDLFPPPRAYVELHIEQGPVLERARARLGVVTAIAGQRRFTVTVNGEAGHAGTVPMAGRADALCAAAELILAIEATASRVGDAVATVGWLKVDPNQTNIVPGRVTFRVDARSVDDTRVLAIENALRAAATRVAFARGVHVDVALTEARAAVPMDPALRELVRDRCLAFDPRAMDIASGAGHDAMCIAHVAPTAMIFVPSVGGRSHVGTERTEPADLELGVEALEATLLAAADRY